MDDSDDFNDRMQAAENLLTTKKLMDETAPWVTSPNPDAKAARAEIEQLHARAMRRMGDNR